MCQVVVLLARALAPSPQKCPPLRLPSPDYAPYYLAAIFTSLYPMCGLSDPPSRSPRPRGRALQLLQPPLGAHLLLSDPPGRLLLQTALTWAALRARLGARLPVPAAGSRTPPPPLAPVP